MLHKKLCRPGGNRHDAVMGKRAPRPPHPAPNAAGQRPPVSVGVRTAPAGKASSVGGRGGHVQARPSGRPCTDQRLRCLNAHSRGRNLCPSRTAWKSLRRRPELQTRSPSPRGLGPRPIAEPPPRQSRVQENLFSLVPGSAGPWGPPARAAPARGARPKAATTPACRARTAQTRVCLSLSSWGAGGRLALRRPLAAPRECQAGQGSRAAHRPLPHEAGVP